MEYDDDFGDDHFDADGRYHMEPLDDDGQPIDDDWVF